MGRAVNRLLRCGVVLAFVVAPFAVPGHPVQAATGGGDVIFTGSGWGHGVGLSQYGAYAMAKLGSDYSAILKHYYKGTSLQQLDPSTTLWVNLERDRSAIALTVGDAFTGSPGAAVSITGNGISSTAVRGASIAISLTGTDGCTLTVTNPGEDPIELIDEAACSFDFSWYDWATAGMNPTTKIVIGGCTLADWNATPTQWVPCQYARGMLHLRSGTGGLDLSAEMLMDDYVRGISEMPYYWTEIEALKAQAVAARSYAEGRRITRGNPAANSCGAWCHVKDTAVDQRYVGWGHSNTSSWVAASESTAGEVLTHPNSSLGAMGVVTAFYSSSTGGATEFGHVVGYSSSQVEWLTSVSDAWAIDGTVWNPNSSWTVTRSAAEIAAKVGLDDLTSVEVIERRPGSNSVSLVEFGGFKDGAFITVVKNGSFMTNNSAGLALKSQYFDVEFRVDGDEMFFYRSSDGEFRYYDISPGGMLGSPILSGSGYSTGWSSISAVDLDGDGQDEMFFYRSSDGAYRYYDVKSNGQLGSPIVGGTGYSTGWSSITALELDG